MTAVASIHPLYTPLTSSSDSLTYKVASDPDEIGGTVSTVGQRNDAEPGVAPRFGARSRCRDRQLAAGVSSGARVDRYNADYPEAEFVAAGAKLAKVTDELKGRMLKKAAER